MKKNNYFGAANNGLFMSGNMGRMQSFMDYPLDQSKASSLLPTNIDVIITMIIKEIIINFSK